MPRPFSVLPCALITLGLLLLTLPAAAGAATPEEEALSGMNEIRGAHGLPPLTASPALGSSSGGFAGSMMARDRLGHRGWVNGTRRLRGEVIALHWGVRPRPGWAVRAWVGSPSHRAVLLNRSLTMVGVARSVGRFGRRRATIWVARFSSG